MAAQDQGSSAPGSSWREWSRSLRSLDEPGPAASATRRSGGGGDWSADEFDVDLQWPSSPLVDRPSDESRDDGTNAASISTPTSRRAPPGAPLDAALFDRLSGLQNDLAAVSLRLDALLAESATFRSVIADHIDDLANSMTSAIAGVAARPAGDHGDLGGIVPVTEEALNEVVADAVRVLRNEVRTLSGEVGAAPEPAGSALSDLAGEVAAVREELGELRRRIPVRARPEPAGPVSATLDDDDVDRIAAEVVRRLEERFEVESDTAG